MYTCFLLLKIINLNHAWRSNTMSDIEERKLTGGEKRSKEAKFKKLKKVKGDFVDRYGKDAESVMHAVATKQARALEKTAVQAPGRAPGRIPASPR